jgi:hypothetical protein
MPGTREIKSKEKEKADRTQLRMSDKLDPSIPIPIRLPVRIRFLTIPAVLADLILVHQIT